MRTAAKDLALPRHGRSAVTSQTEQLTGAPWVIDAQHLQKDFGAGLVLRDLTLRVAPGEVFGLIGPSGSGKSTAIHLFCGRLRPTSGYVAVLGEEPIRFSNATRRRIGYMPQSFVLYPDLTVQQNINFAAGLYGLPEWRNRDRVRKTLELVELWDVRNRVARAVSGGMQRRIALAAALVHNPDLLFADEPTANLDPILRARLWSFFRARSAMGHSLLVTTQYIDEAEYCDRVGLMFDGTLIADGPPAQLRRRAFGGDVIDIVIDRPSLRYLAVVDAVTGVQAVDVPPDRPLRVIVADAERAIPLLMAALSAAGATVRSLNQYYPTFDEVFIRLIEQHGGPRPPLGKLQTSAVDEE